jgi:hypothetical protein
MDRFGAQIFAVLDQLLADIAANPGAAGIPQVRQARQMAIDMGREDAEADLNADLAARLLAPMPLTVS